MTVRLTGPDGRYQITLEALASRDAKHYTRSSTELGFPLGEAGAGEGGTPPPSAYLVVVDETCSLILVPGESGVTVRDLRLLSACHLRLSARVTPGPRAPDWLPTESTYLLFDGDSLAAAALPERYHPFDGVAGEERWPETDRAPLDVLAVAVGRSIARANTVLTSSQSPGGEAILSAVTVRVGLSRIDLGQNRVLLSLARPEAGQAEQYVELSFQTGATAPEEEGTE